MKNSLILMAGLAGCGATVDYRKEPSLSPSTVEQISTLSAQFATDCKTWLDPEKSAELPPNALANTKAQVVAVLQGSGCEPHVMMACNTMHSPKVDQNIAVVDQGGDVSNCEK